jgi:hypothetical protein
MAKRLQATDVATTEIPDLLVLAAIERAACHGRATPLRSLRGRSLTTWAFPGAHAAFGSTRWRAPGRLSARVTTESRCGS